MNPPTPYHRIFGLSWLDFFDDTGVKVRTELDLAIKSQELDLVIIRPNNIEIPRRLPDGFENLGIHNLITFKSFQQPLDAWTLHELVGHYVNYRKNEGPTPDSPLTETECRLFAVAARYPRDLAKRVNLSRVQAGVYDVEGLGLTIRIIVAGELPEEQQNAMLLLFSANEQRIRHGREHYRPHSPESNTLLLRLMWAYSEEQVMPDKLKEYIRQSLDEILHSLPADELRRTLSVEELRKALPVEERLKGLSADEMIRALTPEMLEALKSRLTGNGAAH